jgi:Holliday junction resolvase
MGKSQRAKGRRGEAEALLVLAERGYTVADLTAGVSCEDVLAVKDGIVTSVEVKHRRIVNLADFEKQAREQAKRRRANHWLLMVRLDGYPLTFLVTGSDMTPTVWKGVGA